MGREAVPIVRKTRRLLALCATLLSLLLVVGTPTHEYAVAATSQYLTVRVMDLNDSGYIVELPNGKVMVVDAGQPSELAGVYSRLDARGITRIDYLVGTHEHSDHIGNFADILSRYAVGTVIFPNAPATCSNSYCTAMKQKASQKGVTIRYLRAGANVFPAQTVNGLTLSSTVFAPNATDDYSGDYPVGTANYVNSYSLIFNITYGGRSVLFTGDATPPAQNKLMAAATLGTTHVLTAPHHGYDGTTGTDAFLNYLESRSLSKIVIENPKDCGSVVDFKYRLKTRGTTAFWSTQTNHDFYYRTDGSAWSASVRGEWVPGDAVVAPPADHACP